MRRFLLLSAATLLVALATGCDTVAPDTADGLGDGLGAAPPTAHAAVPSTQVINGYTVEFLGATPGTGGTRFAYRISNLNPGPPALDWVFLENVCAAPAVSVEPSQSARTTTVDGVSGIQWTQGLGANESREYAYTISGAALGVTRMKVRRGGVLAEAYLPGPCGGLATLAGSVFVNGDASGARAANELGLGNVRVEVREGTTNVGSALTGPDGAFSFTLLRNAFTAAPAYTVVVPAAAEGAFNGTLYSSYTSATSSPAQQAVTLAGNVSGVDFGFNPNRQQIIADLTAGPYQTEARSLRTWLGFLRDARRNRTCNAADPDVVCRADALAYLRSILDDPTTTADAFYLLSNPFVGVAETNENALLDWAVARLGANPRTDVERVSQKLLAMQLNRERGWGTDDPAYELALQSYLEAWVNNAGAGASAFALDGLRTSGGGGGGTVEEAMADAYLKLGGGGGGTVDE